MLRDVDDLLYKCAYVSPNDMPVFVFRDFCARFVVSARAACSTDSLTFCLLCARRNFQITFCVPPRDGSTHFSGRKNVYFDHQSSTCMQDSPNHVVVFHCKDGSSRSGCMSACFLLYGGLRVNAVSALSYYHTKRSRDCKVMCSPAMLDLIWS